MQINSLKSDNSKMSQELAHIKSENKTLKEEIKNLQLLFSKKTEVNELDSKISFGELLNSKKVETPLVNRVKAAGVTLLVQEANTPTHYSRSCCSPLDYFSTIWHLYAQTCQLLCQKFLQRERKFQWYSRLPLLHFTQGN